MCSHPSVLYSIHDPCDHVPSSNVMLAAKAKYIQMAESRVATGGIHPGGGLLGIPLLPCPCQGILPGRQAVFAAQIPAGSCSQAVNCTMVGITQYQVLFPAIVDMIR